MRIKVTEAGVVIPRDMLAGVEEVEVRVEGNAVILMPVDATDDPLWQMGNDPVTCGLQDASANHDRYLYQSSSETPR